jgi:choline dehydrogenase-like flavoprotein
LRQSRLTAYRRADAPKSGAPLNANVCTGHDALPDLLPYFKRLEIVPKVIPQTAQMSWHVIETCKMGVDDASVVAPELRVCGIASLRVVDTSICPTIPSSNTNAAALAIGENGADMMLAAASA